MSAPADHGAAPAFASVGENVAVDPTARILRGERIKVGSHVRIDAFALLSPGEGGIEIGDFVHISAHTFIAGAGRIEIAEFAQVGVGASIFSSLDDYSGKTLVGGTVPAHLRGVESGPVTLERHVIVATGSVVLQGVRLGEGSAVGALSLVKEDVEPLAIVAGCPARRVGERSPEIFELGESLGPGLGNRS